MDSESKEIVSDFKRKGLDPWASDPESDSGDEEVLAEGFGIPRFSPSPDIYRFSLDAPLHTYTD